MPAMWWTAGRAVALAALGLLAGCTAGAPPSSSTPVTPATVSVAPAPTHLSGSGCPVADTALCQRAVIAANALLAGAPAGVRAVAEVERFACDEMPAGAVPACRPGVTLTGHGVYSVATKIGVVPAGEYERWLRDLFDRVEPGYADERGTGRFAVLGVGTCGPDDPQRRSYHLAFTAALRGDGGQPAQRWLGSLEFVVREGRWVVPLLYLDSVAAWRREYADPFRDLACGNVQPWRWT